MAETLGLNATNSTSTAFGGVQEVDFFTPADLAVDNIWWDLGGSGNFTLHIDGVLINTRTGVSGDNTDMLSGAGPITIVRGGHTITLTRTSGSASWRYIPLGNGWTDRWYHIGYWKAAGGSELPGLRITATADAEWAYDELELGWETSNNLHATVTNTMTFAQPILLRGLSVVISQLTPCELLIDGVVVGDNTGFAGDPNVGASQTYPGVGAWIDCTPNVVVAQGAHTIVLRRVDLGTFDGPQYIVDALDPPSLPSINGMFDTSAWVEVGTDVFPSFRWHFTALPGQPWSRLSLGPTMTGMSVARPGVST